MIKPEEVSLIFGKWKKESTPLRLVCKFLDVYCDFDCRLIGFSSGTIGLKLSGNEEHCEISLVGFSFDYGEPRTPEEAKPDELGKVHTSALVGMRTSGERILLMAQQQ